MQHQLPLDFEFNNELTLESFVAGPNMEVLNALQKIATDEAGFYVYLWGAEGVGKSHLLQAACQRIASVGEPVALLHLELHEQYAPQMLEGLENLALVCIDNIHAIAGLTDWEEALFHLFNRVYDKKTPLLISATKSPTQIDIQLRDLKSRLAWGLVLQLKSLSDEQKITALQKRAHIRGMELNDEVGRFLLTRYSRDMGSLIDLLDMLDEASLSEQRRLTIPFVRQYLEKDN
jgi:DnaA family protein